ncbi:hypothetical protein GGD52_003804 [Agrobacterium tumefaciens]|nr:hypothetical protein [Agrobacterium radiobacter]MBB5589183.1 hypothetical protein [Agrobacterium radiobacter]
MSLERRIQSKGDELPAKVFSPIGGPSRLTFLNSLLKGSEPSAYPLKYTKLLKIASLRACRLEPLTFNAMQVPLFVSK